MKKSPPSQSPHDDEIAHGRRTAGGRILRVLAMMVTSLVIISGAVRDGRGPSVIPAQSSVDADEVDVLLGLRDHLRHQARTIEAVAKEVGTGRSSAGRLLTAIDAFEDRHRSMLELLPEATIRWPQHAELIVGLRREVARYREAVQHRARTLGLLDRPATAAAALLADEEDDYRAVRGRVEEFLRQVPEPEPVQWAAPSPAPRRAVPEDRSRGTTPVPTLDHVLARLRSMVGRGHPRQTAPREPLVP